jgi:hypothetical protein
MPVFRRAADSLREIGADLEAKNRNSYSADRRRTTNDPAIRAARPLATRPTIAAKKDAIA